MNFEEKHTPETIDIKVALSGHKKETWHDLCPFFIALLKEREKLINGLLTIVHYASEDGVHWKLDRCYTTARDILKEIGVTVE